MNEAGKRVVIAKELAPLIGARANILAVSNACLPASFQVECVTHDILDTIVADHKDNGNRVMVFVGKPDGTAAFVYYSDTWWRVR